MSKGGKLLEVKGLEVQASGRTILFPTDLTLEAGEWKAVIGPNGAGKSTLLKAIATLMPAKGVVRYRGASIDEKPLMYRRDLGVLLHESLLYKELTARENLVFYARLYGVENAEQAVRRQLEAVGLSAYAHEPVGRFSRGMTQRLALARALLHGPRLLLLDEPLSGLDARAEQAILDTFRRAKDAGIAALWVTHRWRQAWRLVDEIVEVRQGRISAVTRTAEADPECWEPAFVKGGPE